LYSKHVWGVDAGGTGGAHSRLALTTQEKQFYQRLGRLVFRARTRPDGRISQAALALALGLSRTSVTNIERGRQPVQLYTLYKIAEILGVVPTQLLPAASNAGVRQGSETSLRQSEWLEKINPGGEKTNASSAGKNSAAGKRAT